MPVPEQRLIDIDGATLEVSIAGDARPAICSTHPSHAMTAEQAASWDWPTVVGKRRVVEVNPRGLGTSAPVRFQREMTFGQLVDDLEALRQRLGLERWISFGGSSGGCIGLLYALHDPRSLAGLIVAFSTPSGDGFLTDPAFDHEFKPYFHRLPDGSWINLAYREHAELTIQLRANLDELGVFDVRHRLGEIIIPTLVIAGLRDTTHPPSQSHEIHAGIPGSELLLLAHTGHGEVADEDRDLYRATVQRFLASLPP